MNRDIGLGLGQLASVTVGHLETDDARGDVRRIGVGVLISDVLNQLGDRFRIRVAGQGHFEPAVDRLNVADVIAAVGHHGSAELIIIHADLSRGVPLMQNGDGILSLGIQDLHHQLAPFKVWAVQIGDLGQGSARVQSHRTVRFGVKEGVTIKVGDFGRVIWRVLHDHLKAHLRAGPARVGRGHRHHGRPDS